MRIALLAQVNQEQPVEETGPRDAEGAGGAQSGEFPSDSAGFLELLRSRDAQFDNIPLETEKSWTEHVDPQAWVAKDRFASSRLPIDTRPDIPEHIPPPYDQPHRVRYQLTVRGSEVTLEGGDELEQIEHPEFGYQQAKALKWTTAGNVQRTYDEGVRGEGSYIHERGERSPNGLIELYRMATEFAHGYAFARRMVKIDAYRVEGDHAFCTGPIHIAVDDDSRCETEVDADLIVRRATILTEKDGGISRMEVETTGIVHPDGVPPVAEAGAFRRVVIPPGGDGATMRENVLDDYRFPFASIVAALTDERYAAITRIEPKADTVVYREGKAVRKSRGKDARVGPTPVTPKVGRLWLLLTLNAIVVLLLSAACFLGTRRRGSKD